jgi:hypothetical protein
VAAVLRSLTGLRFDHLYPGRKEDVGYNPAGKDSDLVLGNQSAGAIATEGNAATGLVPGNGLSEVQFEFPSVDSYARATDPTIGDTAVSMLLLTVYKSTTALPSGSTGLVGKRTVGDSAKGWQVGHISTGPVRSFWDEGTPSSSEQTLQSAWYDDWSVVATYRDVANDTSIIQSSVHAADESLNLNDRDTTKADAHLSLNRSEVTGGGQSVIALVALAEGDHLDGMTAAQIYDIAMAVHERMIAPSAKVELFRATHVAWQGIYAGSTIDLGDVGHDLTLVGDAAENAATTGLVAGNGISEVAIVTTEADATDDAAAASDNDVMRSTATSLLLLVGFKSDQLPAAGKSLIGHRVTSSPFAGWEVAITTGGAVFVRYDWGAADAAITLVGDHCDDEWHWFTMLVDATALDIECETDLDTNVPVAIAAVSDAAVNGAIGSQRLVAMNLETAIAVWRRAADVEGTDLGALIASVDAAMVA